MSHVFVTDAQMRSSLAVIRSLGARGLRVTAGEETRFATSFLSRFCRHKVVYPSPWKRREAFVSYLLMLLKKTEYDVLFPVADNCLGPIVDNEEEISRYTRVALPARKIFLNGYDKGNTIKIAMKNNIHCPQTYFVRDLEGVYNIKDKIKYPAVIKPRISSGGRGVEVCNSFDELLIRYKAVSEKYGNLVIQEYIPSGEELGVYTLFDHSSKPKALTVQRRIRSYPTTGGPSTLRETIKNEISEKAVEITFRLLKAMKWTGVAMVEFRVDRRDGKLVLMEVNPRFWGSLQLSILAGVDFPYLLYRMMVGENIEPALNYKEGVRCRWLLPGDILWFFSAPGKVKNMRQFFRFDAPDDIISWKDPGPTAGFMLAVARYLFNKDMWEFVLRKPAA